MLLQVEHWAWIFAGICSFLSLVVVSWVVFNHLVHYVSPPVQRPMVRILILVPVYAVDSYLALVFKDWALYFDLARDCYEGYVLYTFFTLLVAFMGGESPLICILEDKPPVKHPFPLSLCNVTFKPGSDFLHRCKQMVLQFVVVRPLFSLLAVLMMIFDVYGEGSLSPSSGYLYVTIVNNVSITFSMYYLVLFYTALKDDLAPFRAVSKFLCVKSVIFFAFWSFCITVLAHFGLLHDVGVWTTLDISRSLQDFLICVEMLPLGFAFAYAFGASSFATEGYQMLGRNIVPALRNFGDIVDVRDVGYDAYRSFAGGPRRNVVLDDFGTLNVEEQLTRVVKQGWLYKSGQLQLHNTTILYKRRYVILLSQPPCLVYYKYNPYSHLESSKQGQHIRSSLQEDTTTALGRRAKDLAKKVLIKNDEDLEGATDDPLRPLGVVDLKSVISVHDTSRSSWIGLWTKEYSFSLVTRDRFWEFKAPGSRAVHEWLEALQAVIHQCQAEESSTHPSAIIQYNGISARAKGNEVDDEVVVVDDGGEDEDVLLASEARPQLFDESGAATWQGPPTGQQEITTSLEEEEESIEMASI